MRKAFLAWPGAVLMCAGLALTWWPLGLMGAGACLLVAAWEVEE